MGRLKIKQEDNSKEVVAYLSDVQPIATDLDNLIDEVENVAGIGRTNETVKGNAEDIKNLQNNKVEKSSGKSLISDTEIQRLANVGNYDDAPVKQDIQNLQSNKANKVDVYTKAEIDNKVSAVYKYKGSVATFSTLPTASRTIGDVYNVLDTGINYAWDGTSWDDLGGVEALATASNNGLISKEDFTKLQNITAGATKVEKSTANGNIKLNGTETKVYDDTGLAGVGRTSETVKDNADDILTLQEDKVDKVDGKGLSVNDYTTTEKDKLGLIEAEANKTTIANNLTETVVGKALDATQGKVLDNKIGVLTEKVKPETLLNTTSQNLTGAVNEVNGEVVSAKQSTVKNKTFSSLDARLEESEQDLVAHKLDYVEQRSQDQLKVAKVEKDINDYKSTMANVNVNQEPKQKVTGYGVVSLPKNAANGQVSVSVKGQNATNIVKNGDFRDGTTAQFTKGYCTANVSNKIATITMNGITYYPSFSVNNSYKIKNPVVGDIYYLSSKIKKTTTNGDEISLECIDPINNTVDSISNPEINKEYFLSGLFTTKVTSTEVALKVIFEYPSKEEALNQKVEVRELKQINLTQVFGAGNEPTKEECDVIFSNYIDGTKSTISASRLKSVDKDGIQESTLYLPNVGELRSVPSAKDEIRLSGGKAELVKRVSDEILIDGSWGWKFSEIPNDGNSVYIVTRPIFLENYLPPSAVTSSPYTIKINPGGLSWAEQLDTVELYMHPYGEVGCFIRLSTVRTGLSLSSSISEIRNYLNDNPITLIYQLPEPIITSIQTSGNLISYPSGTIYIEPYTTVAGIYNSDISILANELPIVSIDKISKIDFITGNETILDVSKAVIDVNKLSFTHPDLVDGDIVFFEYMYPQEITTLGESTIEYFDSRYTIKDSIVPNKFYKWELTVANGIPAINLVEVL